MKFKGIGCEKSKVYNKIMGKKLRRCSKQNQFEVQKMQAERQDLKKNLFHKMTRGPSALQENNQGITLAQQGYPKQYACENPNLKHFI